MTSAPRARLSFDLDVDVCVIGGGLAGLTVAREIARRGWSVAVLEANRMAWAASGRNTGFVLPGFSEDVESMVERIGLDHAKQLMGAVGGRRRLCAPRDRRDRHAGCRSRMDGWLDVSKTDNDGELRNRVERLRWIGANVEVWPSERVRAVLPSRYYFSAAALPARLPHSSAQLRARTCGGRGAGGRAHFRGHAGSGDRCGRRAQAHRHAGRARARRACGAGRQCASRIADAAAGSDADADHHLCDGDRADRSAFARRHPLSRRGHRRRCAPTTIIASSAVQIPAAKDCNGPGA